MTEVRVRPPAVDLRTDRWKVARAAIEAWCVTQMIWWDLPKFSNIQTHLSYALSI